MINFPEYNDILEQEKNLTNIIEVQNDLIKQKQIKTSTAEQFKKEIELIDSNNWDPDQKKIIKDEKDTIMDPVKKLQNILKMFNELHIKQVDQSDHYAENFNLIQHLLSFEEEMNAYIKKTGLTPKEVFNRVENFYEDYEDLQRHIEQMLCFFQTHSCKKTYCKKYKQYGNEKFFMCEKDFPKMRTN